jgi:hypothetical protein
VGIGDDRRAHRRRDGPGQGQRRQVRPRTNDSARRRPAWIVRLRNAEPLLRRDGCHSPVVVPNVRTSRRVILPLTTLTGTVAFSMALAYVAPSGTGHDRLHDPSLPDRRDERPGRAARTAEVHSRAQSNSHGSLICGPSVRLQDGLVTPIRSDLAQAALPQFSCLTRAAPAGIDSFRGLPHNRRPQRGRPGRPDAHPPATSPPRAGPNKHLSGCSPVDPSLARSNGKD